MIDALKSWLRWVYDWITVLAASLVGLPSLLLQILSALDGIDLTSILPAEHALKIVTGVALTKAALAFIEKQMTKEEE